MNDTNNYTGILIIYKTKSEVFKVAHENRHFFNSFGEALKCAYKFYNPQ